MDEHIASEFIKLLRSTQPSQPSIEMGEIVAPPPDTSIRFERDKKIILKNSELLIHSSLKDEFDSLMASGRQNELTGSRVLLAKISESLYVLLCKVVDM